MPEGTEVPTNGRAAESGAYIVSTDSGGTFVDAVILDAAGNLTIGKSPTTPEDPALGIIAAVGAAAERAGLDLRTVLGQCVMFLNGTTVTTNAMIQRTGAKTGLITTRGFNLYTELLKWIGQVDPSLAPEPPPVYAAACRWMPAGNSSRVEAWAYALAVGAPLPTPPLWLTVDLAVPLELEASYEETCRILRIA